MSSRSSFLCPPIPQRSRVLEPPVSGPFLRSFMSFGEDGTHTQMKGSDRVLGQELCTSPEEGEGRGDQTSRSHWGRGCLWGCGAAPGDDRAEAGVWFLRQRGQEPGRPSRPSSDPLCVRKPNLASYRGVMYLKRKSHFKAFSCWQTVFSEQVVVIFRTGVEILENIMCDTLMRMASQCSQQSGTMCFD